jgi:predicted nucleic acid-binding Zn ribbon protein
MPFQSLGGVLGHLEQRYTTPERQQYQQLVRHWVEIVGEHVAMQTRPLAIQRGVLSVATASAAWAQNLVFERQRILAKLNAALALSLTDIRFSTAQWHSAAATPSAPESDALQLWHQHPSRIRGALSPKPSRQAQIPEALDAKQAFLRWQTLMRSRTQHLTPCSQCQCPTPPGELERWGICSLCAAKAMGDRQP